MLLVGLGDFVLCSVFPLFIPCLGHCSFIVGVVMGCIVIVLVVKIVSVNMLCLISVSLGVGSLLFDSVCFRAGYMVMVFAFQLFCISVGGWGWGVSLFCWYVRWQVFGGFCVTTSFRCGAPFFFGML